MAPQLPVSPSSTAHPSFAESLGVQSMVAPLRRVLMKRPDAVFGEADPERWHYSARPDLSAAQAEHDALADLLRAAGAEVVYHGVLQEDRADAIYVFDPALLTDRGAVILQMGKPLRRGEEAVMAERLAELGIPTLFWLEGEARAEGGDLLWLDPNTLVVGLGFRTNRVAAEQLRRGLAHHGIEVLTADLPYHTGPEACLHLLSMISMVDQDLAVTFSPLMAVSLVQELERRGIVRVEAPEEEFPTQGPNVLAVGPRRCILLEGNPITQQRLEAAGCQVMTYRGREISWKAEGGPTCLTRPLLRG